MNRISAQFLAATLALLVVGPALPKGKDGQENTNNANRRTGKIALQAEGRGQPELTFHNAADIPEPALPAQAIPVALASADFNEDGRTDLVTSYRTDEKGQLSLRFGDGRGTFSEPIYFDLQGSRPTAMAVGDFNLDGHQDVVVGYEDFHQLSLFEGTDQGKLGPAKAYMIGWSGCRAMISHDLDKDGYMDVLVAQADPASVVLVPGRGPKGFEDPLPLYTWSSRTPIELVAMQIADLDQDNMPDVAVAYNGDTSRVDVLLAANAYTPTTLPLMGGETLSALAVGDVNADGTLDIMVADSGSGSVLLFAGHESADQFLAPRSFAAGPNPRALTVAYLNGDAYADLVVVNGSNDQVALLLGNGRGQFTAPVALGVQGGPVVALAAPLNQDALDDLVIGKEDGGPVVLALSEPPRVVVTTTRDVMDIPANGQITDLPGRDGLVSLREAIVATNNTPGPQTIEFRLSDTDLGFNGRVFKFSPSGSLPALTDGGTTIDATVQSLMTGDTNPSGPEIVLDGSKAGAVDGITLRSSVNVIRGLVINRFQFSGVKIIDLATGNIIAGCYIGTDETGTKAAGNGLFGVLITRSGSQANIIGGTTPEDRNVISGNNGNGIEFDFPTTGNRIWGNFIGTNATGTAAVPNGGDGVVVAGVKANDVGSDVPGARNVIAGNAGNGVSIIGGLGNRVLGNFIGTRWDGLQAIPNGSNGIIISTEAQAMTIGGTSANARNVISGNSGHGIFLTSVYGMNVWGNFIGTNVNGQAALGNGGNGILLNAKSSDNQIGHTIPEGRNLISGNDGHGIGFSGGATNNRVIGNFIGTDVAGQAPLGNLGDGFHLEGVSNNTIGLNVAGGGNVISSNDGDGIYMKEAINNRVVGNIIGANLNRTAALGNGGNGLSLEDSQRNTIGGPSINSGNMIAHNGQSGAMIIGASVSNRVTKNIFFDNAWLGIDLGGDGVTPNDPDDLESGPNQLRNFPIITSVTTVTGGFTVSGFQPSLAPVGMNVELCVASPNPSGFGEGAGWLIDVQPDANGNFSVFVPGTVNGIQLTASGVQITATTTDIAGNTSEFSPNYTIGVGDTQPPTVALLSPNGGEVLQAGSVFPIRLRSFDNMAVASQDIMLSMDGGATYNPIATSLTGRVQQYHWQVPLGLDTSKGRICIVASDGAGNVARDCSDDNFTIYTPDVRPPTVLLTSPNGGEVLAAGQPVTISWSASDNQQQAIFCDLLLSIDGGATYTTIVSGLTGVQSYDWAVPASVSTTRARIRVVCRDAAGNRSQDESDASFFIDKTPPAVTIVTPNGGEIMLRAGVPLTIEWMASDDVAVASYDVLVSIDGGTSFTAVVTGLPGTAQSYNWEVPKDRVLRSARARIRVVARDLVGRTGYDDSDRNFFLYRF